MCCMYQMVQGYHHDNSGSIGRSSEEKKDGQHSIIMTTIIITIIIMSEFKISRFHVSKY